MILGELIRGQERDLIKNGQIATPDFGTTMDISNVVEELLSRRARGDDFVGFRLRGYDLGKDRAGFLLGFEKAFIRAIGGSAKLIEIAKRARWNEERTAAALDGLTLLNNNSMASLKKTDPIVAVVARIPLVLVSPDAIDFPQLAVFADYIYFMMNQTTPQILPIFELIEDLQNWP